MDISGEALKDNCPLYKNCKWEFLYYSRFNNYNLPVYKCSNCLLQTIFPKPNLETLYSKEYFTGESKFSYKDERSFEKYERIVWKARLKNIQKYKPKGKILEIGSSFGGFLNCAKEFGYEVLGVEISDYASKHANNRNVNTICGNFLEVDLNQKFDIIILIEVIEHLPYPDKVFEKLSKHLNANGLLILQTANFDGLQAISEKENYHYYLPGHFYYYSESNLRQILDKYGFKKHISFFGVDFPLVAKLLKSRGSFTKWTDYFYKWFKTSYYHFKSKLSYKNKRLTSSMVLYSFKR